MEHPHRAPRALNVDGIDLRVHPQRLAPRAWPELQREAVAWSYDLLDDEERALFRQLGVFVDGFSLPAVEVVCAGTLDGMASLVDKSLVQADAPLTSADGGGPRFRMLETIREFAREQVDAGGDGAATQARHAAYFLALAEHGDPGDGPPDIGRLKRLDAERGNLRAALRFLIDCRDGERAARLAAALTWFWKVRGFVDEELAWLREVLDLIGESDRTPVRARLLLEAARPAFRHSDNDLAWQRVEESLALYRELGDRRGVAVALQLVGHLCWRLP